MGDIGKGLGTGYPAALDTQSAVEVNSPAANKTKARAEVVNDSIAAILAIETALGTTPQGAKTDVKTFLQTEHNTDGTHNKLTKVTDPWVDVRAYGAKGDGVTDDTTAVQAAINSFLSTGGGIVCFPSGKYLISSTLTLTTNTRLLGYGMYQPVNSLIRNTTLVKKATMTTPILTITGPGAVVENIQFYGLAGNSGDGIVITADTVTLRDVSVYYMGQDGVRIGSDTGADTNAWRLFNVVSSENGRNGVRIHDSVPNANAGMAAGLQVTLNTGDGLYIDKAYTNTFIGILAQSNTGFGIRLTGNSVNNVFFGGDVELNAGGGVIFNLNATGNLFNQTYVQQMTDNSGNYTNLVQSTYSGSAKNSSGSFTPTLTFGGGSTGLTYSTQYGSFTRYANTVTVHLTITLSAKGTSTGAAQINGLPFLASNALVNSGVSFSAYTSFTGLTGALVAQVNAGTSIIPLYQTAGTGAVAITDVVFTNTTNIQLTATYLLY